MTDAEASEQLKLAKESCARWLEYFNNLRNAAPTPNHQPDWEPLHIGFRDDED